MNSAPVIPETPTSAAAQTAEEIGTELLHLYDKIRNLISENNNLKTRLSKALEHKDADLLLEQAEDFQNIFLQYENKLLELCKGSRRQIGMMDQLTVNLAPLCTKVKESVQQLAEELHYLHQQIEQTRDAFGAQFSIPDEEAIN